MVGMTLPGSWITGPEARSYPGTGVTQVTRVTFMGSLLIRAVAVTADLGLVSQPLSKASTRGAVATVGTSIRLRPPRRHTPPGGEGRRLPWRHRCWRSASRPDSHGPTWRPTAPTS